jgi:hypothetical protein
MNLCANCRMGLHSSSAVYSGLRILLAPACHVTPCQKRRKGAGQLSRQKSSVQQAQGGKSLAPCHIACICSSRQKGNIFGRLANGRPIQENKFGIHGMSHFLIAPPTLIAGSDALHQHLAVCTPNHLAGFQFPLVARWVRRAGSPGYQWAEPRKPES